MRVAKWAVLAAAATFCQPLAAAESRWSADAAMNIEYNDNVRLATRSKKTDWTGDLSVGAAWTLSRPESSLYLSPRLRFLRYLNDTALDSTDYDMALAAERDYERQSLRIDGDYSRAAILSSEFNGIGVIEVGTNRDQWNARPAWTVELTPYTQASIKPSYTDVHYEGRAVSQVDYTVGSVAVALTHDLAEDEGLTTTLSGSRMDAPSIDNRVDQAGIEIDYERPATESLRMNGTLGAQKSHFFLANQPERSRTGALLGVTLKSEREYTSWQLTLTRSVDPSGTGTVMQSDTLAASRTANWTPSLSSNLYLLISKRKDLQGLNPGNDSTYGQGHVRLDWTPRDEWDLSIEYRLVGQRLRTAESTAISNAVVLAVAYHGDLAAPK
jgi:hypothetical protein